MWPCWQCARPHDVALWAKTRESSVPWAEIFILQRDTCYVPFFFLTCRERLEHTIWGVNRAVYSPVNNQTTGQYKHAYRPPKEQDCDIYRVAGPGHSGEPAWLAIRFLVESAWLAFHFSICSIFLLIKTLFTTIRTTSYTFSSIFHSYHVDLSRRLFLLSSVHNFFIDPRLILKLGAYWLIWLIPKSLALSDNAARKSFCFPGKFTWHVFRNFWLWKLRIRKSLRQWTFSLVLRNLAEN